MDDLISLISPLEDVLRVALTKQFKYYFLLKKLKKSFSLFSNGFKADKMYLSILTSFILIC